MAGPFDTLNGICAQLVSGVEGQAKGHQREAGATCRIIQWPRFGGVGAWKKFAFADLSIESSATGRVYVLAMVHDHWFVSQPIEYELFSAAMGQAAQTTIAPFAVTKLQGLVLGEQAIRFDFLEKMAISTHDPTTQKAVPHTADVAGKSILCAVDPNRKPACTEVIDGEHFELSGRAPARAPAMAKVEVLDGIVQRVGEE